MKIIEAIPRSTWINTILFLRLKIVKLLQLNYDTLTDTR